MTETMVGMVDVFCATLSLAILARIFVSWYDPGSRTPAGRVLFELTEPIQAPIRQLVPPLGGWLELSCWISLCLIRLLGLTLHQALIA